MRGANKNELHSIVLKVNGEERNAIVASRTTLADCLRDELGLTGTHTCCEHGVCGACTVLLDGHTARSCLLLARQATRCEIRTVEGLQNRDELNLLQQSMPDKQDRKSAVQGKSVAVRVELGGGRIIKKK